jgi:3-isopropylmalate/(R)-2-methylmalate dehydratase small subunit
MQPFVTVTSRAVPLDIVNVDTDQLIPARFMTRPRVEGYGPFLLHDLRYDQEGHERAGFPLNDVAYRDATILVAGRNFGTGSSREAAVYALWDAGFRCVIAPSFGDIFAANAVKNGLLPARVGEADRGRLIAALSADPLMPVTVRLAEQSIAWQDQVAGFEIAPDAKEQLLNGWDDIDMTLRHSEAIAAWAAVDETRRPWARPRRPTNQPDMEVP